LRDKAFVALRHHGIALQTDPLSSVAKSLIIGNLSSLQAGGLRFESCTAHHFHQGPARGHG